jgi:hypothetical protein
MRGVNGNVLLQERWVYFTDPIQPPNEICVYLRFKFFLIRVDSRPFAVKLSQVLPALC